MATEEKKKVRVFCHEFRILKSTDIPFSDVENPRGFHNHGMELALRTTDTDVVQRPVPVIIVKPTERLQKHIVHSNCGIFSKSSREVSCFSPRNRLKVKVCYLI